MIDIEWTRARIETCLRSEERDPPEMTQHFSAEEVSELVDAVELLMVAAQVADDELCAATFVRGTDKKSLNYASKKLRAAISKAKGTK